MITGTTIMWASAVIPKLLSGDQNTLDKPISPDEGSWISSLVLLGAAVGSLIYGFLPYTSRRKPILLCLSILYFIGYAMLAFGTKVEVYYAAR